MLRPLLFLCAAAAVGGCGGADSGNEETVTDESSAASATKLAFTPSSKSFGSVAVGATSAATTFTLKNGGNGTTGKIAISVGGADPSQFELTGDTCAGKALKKGGTCTVTVAFAPTAAGVQAATLRATPSGGTAVTAALSGTGTTPAAISISGSGSFGTVADGTVSQDRTFTVTNTGSASTGPLGVVLSGTNAPAFGIDANTCAGATLAPSATCSVNVHFAPAAGASGAESAILTVSGSPGGSAPVALTGTAGAPATLVLSPAGNYDFGSVAIGSTSATRTYTLTNVGGTTTGAIELYASSSDFTITNSTCTAANGGTDTLAPGQSCTFGVYFKPVAAVSDTATFSATASPGGSASLVLTGTGYPATVALTVQTVLDPNCPPTYIQGTVSYSTPAGTSCSITGYDSSCVTQVPYGTTVGLTLSSQMGTFDGWAGPCSGTSTTCSVTMTSTQVVYVHYCGWVG